MLRKLRGKESLSKETIFFSKGFCLQKSLFTTLRECRNGRVPSRIIQMLF